MIERPSARFVKPVAKAAANVLIVEDDAIAAETIGVCLMRAGFGVRSVTSREAALPVLQTYLYDVIIMDFHMGGMPPEEFLAAVEAQSPRSKVIVVTATAEAAREAQVLPVCDWLRKPFETKELIETINGCV